ncbi:MAG: TetR/AcrR family transcriptional regulator [Robiginitomaculum sp.]|nr:TetR/AcrR family transcriptional regulator [Robiginitomaculum sp.]
MARFSKTDWLETGLNLLSKSGPEAIRIELLCEAAKRTKGSFYHHFTNRAAFVAALISYWQATRTKDIISKTNAGATSPRQRLEDLGVNVLQADGDLENSIRRWSMIDETVANIVQEVDKQRVDYIAGLVAELYRIDVQTAHDLALVQYTVFVGMLMIGQSTGTDRRMALGKLLTRMSDSTFTY